MPFLAFLFLASLPQLLEALQCQGRVYYVVPSTTGSCNSWATACNILNALGKAAEGDCVALAIGRHPVMPSSLLLKPNRTIVGGFDGELYEDYTVEENCRLGESYIELLAMPTKFAVALNGLFGPLPTNVVCMKITGSSVRGGVTIVNGATGVFNDSIIEQTGDSAFLVDGSTLFLNRVVVQNSLASRGAAIYCSGCVLHMRNCTMRRSHATSYGGMIYVIGGGVLNIFQTVFSEGRSDDLGGAILAMGGSMQIQNSSFEGCTASTQGGALFFFSSATVGLTEVIFRECDASSGGAVSSLGTVTGDHLHFIGNTALTNGGAVRLHGRGGFTHSEFIGNRAPSGAAIFSIAASTTLTVAQSSFSDNFARDKGAALYLGVMTASLTNVEFTDNWAGLFGGSIYGDGARIIQCTGVVASGNGAGQFGGFAYIKSYVLRLTNTTIKDSTAALQGGSVSLDGRLSTLIANNASFVRSTSALGGAIHVGESAVLSATDSYFGDCSAQGNGGALFAERGSPISLSRSVFEGCTASDGGAVALEDSGTLDISGSVFLNCNASHGGAIYAFSGNSVLSDTKFVACCADVSGGAITHLFMLSSMIMHCEFIRNKARDGGAVYLDQINSAILLYTEFTENEASDRGGALSSYSCLESLTMHNVTFLRNYGTTAGALGISDCPLIALRSIFQENIAGTRVNLADVTIGVDAILKGVEDGIVTLVSGLGGAVWLDGGGSSFYDCAFVNNHAATGGALHLSQPFSEGPFVVSRITESSFAGNAAFTFAGAAFFSRDVEVEITSCYFALSSSAFAVHLLFDSVGSATVTGSLFDGITPMESLYYGPHETMNADFNANGTRHFVSVAADTSIPRVGGIDFVECVLQNGEAGISSSNPVVVKVLSSALTNFSSTVGLFSAKYGTIVLDQVWIFAVHSATTLFSLQNREQLLVQSLLAEHISGAEYFGMLLQGTNATVSNSMFVECLGLDGGGFSLVEDVALTVRRVLFFNISSSRSSGAITVFGSSTIDLHHGMFENCTGMVAGEAILFAPTAFGESFLSNSTFLKSTKGALAVERSKDLVSWLSVFVQGSLFEDNSAAARGAALVVKGDATSPNMNITLSGCTFRRSVAFSKCPVFDGIAPCGLDIFLGYRPLDDSDLYRQIINPAVFVQSCSFDHRLSPQTIFPLSYAVIGSSNSFVPRFGVLFVSQLGSDEDGDGSAFTPYKTILKALTESPAVIRLSLGFHKAPLSGAGEPVHVDWDVVIEGTSGSYIELPIGKNAFFLANRGSLVLRNLGLVSAAQRNRPIVFVSDQTSVTFDTVRCSNFAVVLKHVLLEKYDTAPRVSLMMIDTVFEKLSLEDQGVMLLEGWNGLKVSLSNCEFTFFSLHRNLILMEEGALFTARDCLFSNIILWDSSSTIVARGLTSIVIEDTIFSNITCESACAFRVEYGGTAHVLRSDFSNLKALRSLSKRDMAPSGSVFLSRVGNVTLDGCNFTDNSAISTSALPKSFGGTNWARGIQFVALGAVNKAQRAMGGVMFLTVSVVTIENCLFQRNSADLGGVIRSESSGNIVIHDSVFERNYALVDGGVFNNDHYTGLEIQENVEFTANKAVFGDGGVFFITDCSLQSGAASNYFGPGVTYRHNTASSGRGGVMSVRCLNIDTSAHLGLEVLAVIQYNAALAGGVFFSSLAWPEYFYALLSANTLHFNSAESYGAVIATDPTAIVWLNRSSDGAELALHEPTVIVGENLAQGLALKMVDAVGQCVHWSALPVQVEFVATHKPTTPESASLTPVYSQRISGRTLDYIVEGYLVPELTLNFLPGKVSIVAQNDFVSVALNVIVVACPAGKELAKDPHPQCTDCSPGWYSQSPGLNGSCSICPEGHYTGGNTTTCLPCPKGQFNSQAGRQMCDSCPEGRFSNVTGLKICHQCSAGSYSNVKGATECTLCELGTAAPTPGMTECTPCDPGNFASQNGTIKCESCHKGAAAPRKRSIICQKCSPGSAADATGQLECSPCQAGTASSRNGSVVCDICPSGSFSDLSGARGCSLCATGSASATNGSTSCLPCKQGEFADKKGMSGCLQCDKGSFSAVEGTSVCSPCPGGSFASYRGQQSCTPCSKGRYALSYGSAECLPCPKGSYAARSGSLVCELCEPGWFSGATGQHSCLRCPEGHISAQGAKECTPCPIIQRLDGTSSAFSSELCGSGVLSLRDGLWWSSEGQITANTSLFECASEASCIVTGNQSDDFAVRCAVGSTGPLCGVCEEGWSGSGGCSKCWSAGWNAVFVLAMGFLMLGLCSFLVIRKLREHRQSETSIVLRVFLSYLQVNLVLTNLRQYGTALFREVVSTTASSSLGISFDAFPMNCLFGWSYMGRLLSTLSIPLLILLLPACLLYGIHLGVERGVLNSDKSRHSVVRLLSDDPGVAYRVTVVFLLFLVLGTITNSAFSGLVCYPHALPGGSELLAADFTVECADIGVVLLSLSGLLFYSVGIPVAALWFLRRNRARLEEKRFNRCFGFLFDGYRKEYFFWEAVVLLRKIALIGVSVLFDHSDWLSSYCANLVLMLALVLHSRIWPFTTPVLNMLELLSLSSTSLLQVLSLLFSEVSDPLLLTGTMLLIFFGTVCVMVGFMIRTRRQRKRQEQQKTQELPSSKEDGFINPMWVQKKTKAENDS